MSDNEHILLPLDETQNALSPATTQALNHCSLSHVYTDWQVQQVTRFQITKKITKTTFGSLLAKSNRQQ